MVCAAFALFADIDQVSAILVVVAAVPCVTAWVFGTAGRSTRGTTHTVSIRRVRQQHRLWSRSWIEVLDENPELWIPVFFDPVLVALPTPTAAEMAGDGSITIDGRRLYRAGRVRDSEPVGRLLDNPSRPAPDATERAAAATRPLRRLILDAQFAVAGPLIGLLWVYIDGGGLGAFVGATCIGGSAAIWLAAIRGSDPS